MVKAMRADRSWWVVAWLVAILYTSVYSWQISRHTAVPYWDQTNYVWKVYSIADWWRQTPFTWSGVARRASPRAYLEAIPPNRPPLLMVLPAALWGGEAQPQQIALSWLFTRMAALMTGVWVLARVTGSARWIPGALCIILARQDFLKLNQNLYLMDLPFASFALLTVALVVWAMTSRKTTAIAAAAACGLALVLIKPQGLLFMAPFFGFLFVERVVFEWRGVQSVGNASKPRLLVSSLAGLLMVSTALVLGLLYVTLSSYGEAVRAQWALGSQGFWTARFPWPVMWAILSGVLPPWLFIAASLSVLRKHGSSPTLRMPLRAWVTVALGTSWWLLFSLRISYAVDPRVVWSISPALACLAMILICRGRASTIAVTALAGGIFAISLGVSAFGWPLREWSSPWFLLGPPTAQQTLVEDVGIRPLVATVEAEVRRQTPAPAPVAVLSLMNDEYVESAGMNLAARWANGNQWSSIRYDSVPLGASGFDFLELFGYTAPADRGWFLTKRKRRSTTLQGDAFVDMETIEALIQDPRSPVFGMFKPVAGVPIHQPLVAETSLMGGGAREWLDDSVTLWRQTRAPTTDETRAALAFVEARYLGKAGQNRIAQQRLSLVGASETNSEPHAPDSSVGPFATGAQIGEVRFLGGELEMSLSIYRNDGATQIRVAWRTSKGLVLEQTWFAHLLDKKGAIVRQLGAPLDPARGHVDAGAIWSEVFTLKDPDLQAINQLGIGLVGVDGNALSLSAPKGTRTDWDSHRLLIPIR